MATMTKKEINALTHELVKQIKAHALENYEKKGWDVVVESWSDEEIFATIYGSWTFKGAVKKMRQYVEGRFEYAQEIINA